MAANVTERGNPDNVKNICLAEVQLPAEILRQGFYFIDTPGLGSSIVENTPTTKAFRPEAEAFVLVTSYDSPLAEEGRRVLDLVRLSSRRVFVVENKRDSVSPGEREQAEEYLRGELARSFGVQTPQLHSVSAGRGLPRGWQATRPHRIVSHRVV